MCVCVYETVHRSSPGVRLLNPLDKTGKVPAAAASRTDNCAGPRRYVNDC